MQTFDFVAKYKTGIANLIADALSRMYNLLNILGARILGFEIIKEQYKDCLDFATLYSQCETEPEPKGLFFVHQGFLFR